MKNLLTYGRAQELEERELELELLELLLLLLLLLLLPNLVMLTDSKKIVSRVFLKFKMKKCDLEFNSSPPCFQLIRKDQKESKKDPEFHFFQFQAAPAAGPSDPRLRLLASKFEVYSPQTGFSHVILIPMMPNMADTGGGREV